MPIQRIGHLQRQMPALPQTILLHFTCVLLIPSTIDCIFHFSDKLLYRVIPARRLSARSSRASLWSLESSFEVRVVKISMCVKIFIQSFNLFQFLRCLYDVAIAKLLPGHSSNIRTYRPPVTRLSASRVLLWSYLRVIIIFHNYYINSKFSFTGICPAGYLQYDSEKVPIGFVAGIKKIQSILFPKYYFIQVKDFVPSNNQIKLINNNRTLKNNMIKW